MESVLGMKKTFTILFILLGTLTIFTSVSLAAELNESELINQSVTDGVALSSESTDPPTNATKLIFIHHSTGQNWLDDDNGEPFTKGTFIAAIIDLHIGEWHRRYSTKRFGYTVVMVRSGSWKLNITMDINR